ncbi:hypothetical protein AM500_10675 [Bacillus sp. FJAT-18017]|nr:hypothetical protein [Bacillus sp. FJAT-18017]ALC90195.1 hypothetical protein AM500_10675 [Bacillus sp. FJAT-18017]
MDKVLEVCDEALRGIGVIPASGWGLKPEYSCFDAKLRFTVDVGEPCKTKCRCGDVIKGLITPDECALFGKTCKPMNPIGPCMVSAEGSCAAFYQYMRETV